MADELNDLAVRARWSAGTQMAGPGLAIGGIIVTSDHPGLGFGLVFAGLVAVVGWTVWTVAWTRRADRRLRARLGSGTAEVVEGRVAAEQVPARVVRQRRGLVALTVLHPDGPHRRAALVRPGSPALAKDAPVVAGLHPTLSDVAVLATGATPEHVRAADADPGWTGRDVPRDRDVVGGWSGMAVAALAGFGASVAVALLLGGIAR